MKNKFSFYSCPLTIQFPFSKATAIYEVVSILPRVFDKCINTSIYNNLYLYPYKVRSIYVCVCMYVSMYPPIYLICICVVVNSLRLVRKMDYLRNDLGIRAYVNLGRAGGVNVTGVPLGSQEGFCWKVRKADTEDLQGSQKLMGKLLQLSCIFEDASLMCLGLRQKSSDSQAKAVVLQSYYESNICLQPPTVSNGFSSFQISHAFL